MFIQVLFYVENFACISLCVPVGRFGRSPLLVTILFKFFTEIFRFRFHSDKILFENRPFV